MKPKTHSLRHDDGKFKKRSTHEKQKRVGQTMRSKTGQLTSVKRAKPLAPIV